MFENLQNYEDFCNDYMDSAMEKVTLKDYTKDLKKLFERLQNEKIPQIDSGFFSQIFMESGSDALLPKYLALDVLKKIVKDEYYHNQHPHSKKSNTSIMEIFLLYTIEESGIIENGEKSFSFQINEEEVPNLLLNYMIEASNEILFREKKREYKAVQSIGEIFTRQSIPVERTKDIEKALTFRCSPNDIKSLDKFLDSVNESFPHNFTQIEILLALVLCSTETLISEKTAFIKHLKKLSLQDPKLTEKKTYKLTDPHIPALFESLHKFIEGQFPDKTYSFGDIFRAMIAYSKEIITTDIAEIIQEIRENNSINKKI